MTQVPLTGVQKMNILALDLATRTGWACNVNGRHSGVIQFNLKRGESPGMRFLRCRSWLTEMLELLGEIDVIVYEQTHHRGGAATSVWVGLVTVVLEFAAEHGIETLPIHSGALKKWSTGSGRANKSQMIKAARERGWSPADDNQADAQLALEYAMAELGLKK